MKHKVVVDPYDDIVRINRILARRRAKKVFRSTVIDTMRASWKYALVAVVVLTFVQWYTSLPPPVVKVYRGEIVWFSYWNEPYTTTHCTIYIPQTHCDSDGDCYTTEHCMAYETIDHDKWTNHVVVDIAVDENATVLREWNHTTGETFKQWNMGDRIEIQETTHWFGRVVDWITVNGVRQ
jgi:hypothetical protein